MGSVSQPPTTSPPEALSLEFVSILWALSWDSLEATKATGRLPGSSPSPCSSSLCPGVGTRGGQPLD